MDNGDWLMFRASGTEPVIRCYFESSNEEKFKIIEKEATEMINSIS
jgi:phosphomannomutase